MHAGLSGSPHLRTLLAILVAFFICCSAKACSLVARAEKKYILLIRVDYREKPFSQDLNLVRVTNRLLWDAKEALPTSKVYRQMDI